MRLALALALFLLAVPFCLTVAWDGLKSDDHDFVDVTMEELASGAGPKSRHVRVEGRLVREGAPDDVLEYGGYHFVFVGDDEALSVVMGDGWTPVPGRTPIIARVSGDRLPTEAFLRPTAGARSIVTPPFTLEGTRRISSHVSDDLADELGLPRNAEVVVIESVSNRLGAGAGVFFGVFGVAFLWWGIWLIRGWRRDRRSYRAMHRAARAGSGQPPPLPGAAAAPTLPTRRARVGIRVPWGKVAVVAAIAGVALAQLARKAGPAATDVARGVTKSADEAAGASRIVAKNTDASKIELPTAGNPAEFAAGRAPDVKTAIQVETSGPSTQRPRGVERSIRFTDKILESLDRYESRGGATFELVRRRSVSEVSGSMSFGAGHSTTETDDELPDRRAGEFIRVTLTEGEAAKTVRLVQTAGIAVEGGYLELFTAAGDLEFVHGGTWEDIERGAPCELRFTDRGRSEFAAGMLPLYQYYTGVSLDKQGVTDKRISASWDDAPEYRVTTKTDGLEIELVRPAQARVSARFRM